MVCKELDFTFVEGDPMFVSIITIDYLNNYMSRIEYGDNQRRTEGYYIIAKDNLLQGV